MSRHIRDLRISAVGPIAAFVKRVFGHRADQLLHFIAVLEYLIVHSIV